MNGETVTCPNNGNGEETTRPRITNYTHTHTHTVVKQQPIKKKNKKNTSYYGSGAGER